MYLFVLLLIQICSTNIFTWIFFLESLRAHFGCVYFLLCCTKNNMIQLLQVFELELAKYQQDSNSDFFQRNDWPDTKILLGHLRNCDVFNMYFDLSNNYSMYFFVNSINQLQQNHGSQGNIPISSFDKIKNYPGYFCIYLETIETWFLFIFGEL